MKKKFFNVKMRASKCNSKNGEQDHISGAERVISESSIETTVNELIKRAINHDKGKADFINISLNEIEEKQIKYIPSLNIETINCKDKYEGRINILRLLKYIGIDDKKGKGILSLLDNIQNMRGAIVLDLMTMDRLEKSKKRGIRVTGVDWESNMKSKLESTLEEYKLNNNHLKEALALASKVMNLKGMLGELCISDDPNYTTGYVTIKNKGYFRITNLKEKGSKKGGRIFLFDSSIGSMDECIEFLENTITLVNTLPKVKKYIIYK